MLRRSIDRVSSVDMHLEVEGSLGGLFKAIMVD